MVRVGIDEKSDIAWPRYKGGGAKWAKATFTISLFTSFKFLSNK